MIDYSCWGPLGVGHYPHTCKNGDTKLSCFPLSFGVYAWGRNVGSTGARHEGGSDERGCFVDICISP